MKVGDHVTIVLGSESFVGRVRRAEPTFGGVMAEVDVIGAKPEAAVETVKAPALGPWPLFRLFHRWGWDL